MAPTVAAIIPSYNEGKRIGAVLDIISSHPRFTEVVVVDASTDKTADVVQRYPRVRYLRQRTQHGKAGAMEEGVQATSSEILFFSDADITGLTHETIDQLLDPVLRDDVDMVIGIRGRRVPLLTKILASVLPTLTLIGGERALRRSLWNQVPLYYKVGYRIENGLNFTAMQSGRGLRTVPTPTIGQKLKEQKYGMRVGLRRRWPLVRDVTEAMIHIQSERGRSTIEKTSPDVNQSPSKIRTDRA
jgi:glycosyltransferase involved in cell wall biosynthesis